MVAVSFVPVTESLSYVAGDPVTFTRWYVGEDLTGESLVGELRARRYFGPAASTNPALGTLTIGLALEADADVLASLVDAAAANGIELDLTGVDVTRLDLEVADTTELPRVVYFDVQRPDGVTIYRGDLAAVGQVSA